MPFLTPLKATLIGTFDGVRQYVVDEPLRYQVPGTEWIVEVPAGTVTDLVTSVPAAARGPRILSRLLRVLLAPVGWIVRRMFPAGGPWDGPAVLHDWLSTRPLVFQVIADAVFRAALREAGVAWWRRVTGFHAVRLYQVCMGRGD